MIWIWYSRFAEPITVLVEGAHTDEGTAEAIAARPARQGGLSRGGRAWLSCSHSTMSSPAMAALVVVRGVSFRLDQGSSLAVLGRNGVGKTTLLDTIIGVTRRCGGAIRFAGRDITALRPEPRAACRHRLGAAGAQHLQIADRRGEPHRGRAPGPWTLARVYKLFPRLAERRRNLGNQLSGGEQQMLAIGTRAGAQSEAAAARRADRRARADHRRGPDGNARAPLPQRGPVDA